MATQLPQPYRCYLEPGHVALSDEPAALCAVCGNGVVVTVWDRARRRGGMAHCIFPKARWGETTSAYHADTALQTLLEEMAVAGSYAGSWEAQLFGGGSRDGFFERRARSVIATVRKVLRHHRITVVSEDTGGRMGRKVVFNTATGDAVVLKTKQVRQTDWMPEYALRPRVT